MGYSEEELGYIFDKTGGHCYHCRKKLAWSNYGVVGARGAWEVDHSRPRSSGGTDYLRNLVPSCIPCNRSKGILTSRRYRERILLDIIQRHPERFPELQQGKKRRKKRPRVPFGMKIADASRILPVSTTIQPFGAYVGEVKQGSPAERAGLQVGDVIVMANWQSIMTALDLERVLARLSKGSRVTMMFKRGGITLYTEVVI
jgi:hypothetical protein